MRRARPSDAAPGGRAPRPPRSNRLVRARAAFAQGLRRLLRPEGLPGGAGDELEAALGDIGREVLAAGPGRMGRVRARVRAAPPRLLDWASGQVVDHPALVLDATDVEELAERQGRSVRTAVGALQLALVGAAAASPLEGGPVLALAIDGVVGQVASVVHGLCDWYTTGSYLVRRLDACGLTVGPAEVRRLTNAALMSRSPAVDARLLDRSTELRLARRWIGHGVIDALPFGTSVGKVAVRAAARVDRTDLSQLVATLRARPGGV